MLLESKSLLAKLMATENIVVEQRNVSTAFFDSTSRVLVIPILNKNIPTHTYDLFMGHEVGHALWTPVDGHEIRKKYDIPHRFANVIEDSRIERKIKYKYPGLKNSFVKGYKDLFDRNFFDTQGYNINSLNFIDRINLHCKGGALMNIHFTEQEKELLKEVESTETYDDVMKVCLKIINFLKEKAKKDEDPNEIHLPFEPEEDEDEDDVSDLLNFNDKKQDESVPDDGKADKTVEEEEEFEGEGDSLSETVDSEEKAEEKSEEKVSNEGKDAGEGDEGSEKSPDGEQDISDLLESHTDNAYRDNEHKLFSTENVTIEYANIPKLEPSEVIVDFKKVYEEYDKFHKKLSWGGYNEDSFYDYAQFKNIREDIKAGVSYLVKEFEMRKSADQLKKATPAKTGDLNMSKIYSHKFNEDIFKKITVVPGAKSHGLVIFLDWSGSMGYHLENTVKQLFNIVMFCKKVNIPYEVYTFTTTPDVFQNFFVQKRKSGDLLMQNFVLLNVLSSRMNAAQFTKAAAALTYMSTPRNDHYSAKIIPDIFSMGGTPLNQTIVAAMEIVPAFQRKNGLQMVNTIFLTDGDGDSGLDRIDYDGSSKRLSIYGGYNNKQIVIRDPVTKHQEKLEFTSCRKLTSGFIKLFKLRTKCNIVGFYILSPNEFKSYILRHCIGEDTQDLRAGFSKNHCVVIENDGYDEYYLLRSKKEDGEIELVVKENASNKALANAFSKYNSKRNTTRVVLNRFINMIA